jgi:hypothetical protein
MVDAAAPPNTMKAGSLSLMDDQTRACRRAEGESGDASAGQVPWFSQFDGAHVPGAGNQACYRACRAMSQAAGVNVPAGTANRIQVATGEDRYGRVNVDPSKLQEARSYIDRQLDAGRPVTVGVSHAAQCSGNVDGITDHFVLVTGRGQDANGTYYTYNDPATTDPTQGRNNRFYVDPKSGNLVHEGSLASGYVRDRHTEMSMVVPSDG